MTVAEDLLHRQIETLVADNARWQTMLANDVVWELPFASLGPASADGACLPLRTFTPEERQQFETQYGVNWWMAMGLIPGPQSAGDWVERPAGDSLPSPCSARGSSGILGLARPTSATRAGRR